MNDSDHIHHPVAYDMINHDDNLELEDNAVLYHGTLAVRNEAARSTLDSMMQRYSLRRFMDANLIDPWWNAGSALTLVNYADIVTLSEKELVILSADMDIHEQDIMARAEQFKLQTHVVNLLIELDNNNTLLIDKDGEVLSSGDAFDVAYYAGNEGVNDAFSSIILLGYANDWDWTTTMQRAQDFAVYTATLNGDRNESMAIYDDFKKLWGIVDDVCA